MLLKYRSAQPAGSSGLIDVRSHEEDEDGEGEEANLHPDGPHELESKTV